MKVHQLVRRLRRAPDDATVLMLVGGIDASDAAEVRFANLPRRAWIHERHHREDGTAEDRYYPQSYGPSTDFNDATDESWTEPVVVLVADRENLQLLLSETAGSGKLDLEAIKAEALEWRRAMLKYGELLREDAFREKLGVSERRFASLVADESVFALDVDGMDAYPAILCSGRLRLKRLWKVARILAPALPDQRFDFLTSKSGALGNRVPIDMLESDSDYRKLRAFAKGWVAEFSRTFVKVYDAAHPKGVPYIEPIYSSATEVDPRRPLWKRALGAVRAPGYRFPHEVPRCPPTVQIVVERHTAGLGSVESEAKIVCDIDERDIRVTVTLEGKLPLAIKVGTPSRNPTVVEVAEVVFTALARQ
ncbi:hypothetical protein NOV72_05002 [Caballeronia novacaledonica]|uniref:Uncharacterized protein n=1 Tax=Caballeronia novacaledonica TaxID=1544861 RepID=A0A2U3IC66_9BURK|nr:hypothetical protein [Caballeronia novacaledonica]SPB17799.1 hypothetical protein NOV72_05002 [Caballeronia novacaledonica]